MYQAHGISDLLVVHDETDELFLRHQELLLERRRPEDAAEGFFPTLERS